MVADTLGGISFVCNREDAGNMTNPFLGFSISYDWQLKNKRNKGIRYYLILVKSFQAEKEASKCLIITIRRIMINNVIVVTR
jgi:hypothetical protein